MDQPCSTNYRGRLSFVLRKPGVALVPRLPRAIVICPFQGYSFLVFCSIFVIEYLSFLTIISTSCLSFWGGSHNDKFPLSDN